MLDRTALVPYMGGLNFEVVQLMDRCAPRPYHECADGVVLLNCTFDPTVSKKVWTFCREPLK